MKKVFVVDWSLLTVFVLTLFSGIAYHIEGHQGTTFAWHIWAVVHTVAGLLFCTTVWAHLATHSKWLRTIADRKPDRRRTLVLLLATLLVVTVATGFCLLFICGANTPTGVWHYRLGIVTGLLALEHTAKRFSVLRKTIGQ